jgi:hypothetical protein
MKTNPAIQINETFMRLVTGAATLSDIVAERGNARTAQSAGEDSHTRRRHKSTEATDPFTLNWCR